MQRVVVVGPPGSGKTTLARRIAVRLGAPHLELDAIWWDPNWTEAGEELFSARAREVVAADRWVLDGNYFTTGARAVIWPRADTIVWLDMARWVTIPRVLRRTLGRVLRRAELWSGNREPISTILRPDGIVRFAWTAHPKYNLRYRGLDTDPNPDPDIAHLTWVRLRSPREVRRWLRTLPAA